MSALAHPLSYSTSAARVPELGATLEISRIVAYVTDPAEALRAIARTALRIKGVFRLEIEDAEPVLTLTGEPVSWARPSNGTASVLGSAVADIHSPLNRWGRLRVHFDLNATDLDSPLRFTRFVAQQIASILTRLSLNLNNESAKQKAVLLRKIVARRKAIRRATAVIARSKKTSEKQALAVLIRHARESRRSLHQVAEAFVFSNAHLWKVQPFRRSARPAPAFPLTSKLSG